MNNRMFAYCRIVCGDASGGIRNVGGNPQPLTAPASREPKEMPGDIPRFLDADPCGRTICAYPLLVSSQKADRIAGGIPRPLTAPVNGKAKRLSGVRPRLSEADPRGVDQYFYNLNLFKQSIALQFLHVLAKSIKNAGGNPRLLEADPFGRTNYFIPRPRVFFQVIIIPEHTF